MKQGKQTYAQREREALMALAVSVALQPDNEHPEHVQAARMRIGGGDVDQFVSALSQSEIIAFNAVLQASQAARDEGAADRVLDEPAPSPDRKLTADETTVLRAALAIARRNDVRRDELLVALIELLPPEDRQRDVSEL